MAESPVDACELCGSSHAAASCPVLSHMEVPGGSDEHREPHLAYQSLPRWVQVQQNGGEVRLVVTREVQRLTRLGPLLAPHIPHHHNTTFPLKICHEGGSYTYLDLSRKWLCNWLSLIPVGSPSSRNLLACQIDDLIYYMAGEDIAVGSELRVWYAPFYQQRLQEELKQVRQDHSLLGAAVVTRKLLSTPIPLTPHSEPQMVIAPSLVRITVGQGQVTFTHSNSNNTWHSEETKTAPGHPLNQLLGLSPATNLQLADSKCGSREILVIRHTQAGSTTATFSHSKNEEQDINKPSYDCSASGNNSECEKSIQVQEENYDSRENNCVVSLTISSSRENMEPGWSYSNDSDYNGLAVEEWHSDSSLDDTGRDTSVLTQKGHKRKYQKAKEEIPVFVADSEVVRQLPPRALGARHSRPWSCQYCQRPNFHSLTGFADHLKGHLLWLIGRHHVCRGCSLSFSNPEQLQRHHQSVHATPHTAHPSTCSSPTALYQGRRKGDQVMKQEALSDEEDADDPDGTSNSKEASTQGMKRIAAIPTEATDGPHNCQICGRSFVKAQYLLRHLRKHSGDFTCKHCLKVFTRKESLQKHICAGSGDEKRLCCDVCHRTFLSQQLLQRHILRHKGSPKCTRCGWKGTTVAALQRHMNLCPSVQVSSFFQCNECGKRLASVKQLERHKAHHRYYRQCHLCNKPYHNSTYLAQHLSLCRQIHQLSSLGHVLCEDCGQEFTDATTFRSHHHTHTHPFLCAACSHRFQTRVGYEVHVCEVEQRCDECGAVFRSVQALNRHAAIHGPPPHPCPSCRRSYYRKESLDRHVCHCEAEVKEKPKQKEQSSFPCHVCGSVLATKHSFNTHMRSAHGEGGAHEVMCEVCGKGFQRSDLLRQHRAVHAPPSLPCPTCNKFFKTRKSLEVHSLIHLNIKRFACKYCNKKFHQKVNLSRHERSHFPRGSVKCQYCATHCSSTEDLKAHLLSHTLIQPQGEKLHQESVITSDKDVSGPQQDLANLEAESENFNLTEKGRVELKQSLKNSKALGSDYSTEIVHAVVPVIASDLSLHTDSVSDNSLNHHQTVFLPQRISNICLSTRQESLNNDYLVSTQPANMSSAASPQNIGNSSVFKVTNDSSSVEDNLPSTVLITTSPVPPLDTSHLGPPAHCQVSVVPREQGGAQVGKISHLNLGPNSSLVEEVCLYQPATTSTPGTTSQNQTQVLNSDHLVKSVVLMAQPPSNNC